MIGAMRCRSLLGSTSLLVIALVIALVASGCLRAPATEAGLQFGYAIDPNWLADEPRYGEIVSADANIVTPENYMKWERIHPEPDTYDFAVADSIVARASEEGQAVRGHVLVWHRQLPAWLTEREWRRGELIRVLRDHIHTVVGHYRDEFPDVVRHWDVVNEALMPDGSRRSSIWQEVIGDNYVDLAFRFARQADPDAVLFYNDFYDDFGVRFEAVSEGMTVVPGATAGRSDCAEVPKCAATRDLVAGMLARHVPIDGVGFQGHITGTNPADYDHLARWTQDLGVEWAVTELDISLPADQGDDPALLAAQAEAYVSVTEDCLDAPNCDTVVLWSVGDADSWIPSASGGVLGHAALYEEDYTPKAAVLEMLTLLEGAG